MTVYLDLIILFNFLVDFLLLLGTNRLCGYPPSPGRAALAALLGGIYGGACVLPGFRFLGNIVWRLISLALMAVLAFGVSFSALRRGLVFSFLSMALGGIVVCMGRGGFWPVLAAAALLALICRFGFRGKLDTNSYVPVELHYGDKHIQLTALRDTGNTLRDPVTGASVLVVGADTARILTGLTMQQLENPMETIHIIPGLRLIPYRSVGQKGGLLLALRLKDVKIGNWKGSSLVAFAPQKLSVEGEYQALTGGIA